ncbi:hypothetical protein BO94DRAFT_622302 [Aspergillus sclerotioniger CBS 115572]|uniref:Uncharacterized protein n=1 Tax=Aspergillus sclerotioniger CBS 115572 TaxID=1450535 RepID=A0A317X6E8_9EURO|nr:hypothetical protein BO94DRAFT_622302 [Aspergillus sclerotioniger CBS 115572]PWY93137.1 hypothetical protein BO94DRAFT_622302 [Aspergillus sclerotioniger CBS 115572]
MQCVRRRESTHDVPAATANPVPNGWLPRSLRRPYLLTLSICMLLIAIAVEILRQYSNRHNGLVKFAREEDLSVLKWRAWTDTPTFLALIIVVFWDVFAQDVLRLEPYFQLACPDSMVSASALFTNYSFDVGVLAPIRSTRNRHWIVLCVSSMSLAMHLLVPALLSGLVILYSDIAVETKTLDTWPHLVDVDTQNNWFSLQATYRTPQNARHGSYPWSNNNVTYAIAPLSSPEDGHDDFLTLSLNQSVYWSEMNCAHTMVMGAIPSRELNITTEESTGRDLSWNLSSITTPGIGSRSPCNLSLTISTVLPSRNGQFQARYWEPVQADLASTFRSMFNANGCLSTGLFGVLIDVETTAATVPSSNITLFACQPAYRQATANVSYARVSSPTSIELVPSTIREMNDTDFSMLGFQKFMSSDYGLTGLSEDFKSSVVVGDSGALLPVQYQETVEQLWNYQFMDTITRLFNQQAVASEGKFLKNPIGIVVVSRTAAIVEMIMILGFMLVFTLNYIYPRRLSLLHKDPSSIAAQCELINRLIGPETLQTLSLPAYHVARTRTLQKWAKGLWCRWSSGPNGRRIELCSRIASPVKTCPPPALATRWDPMPHFLTLPWFVMECVLLIGIVTAFGLTYNWMHFYALDSFESPRVLFSAIFLVYGPTMLASIVHTLSNSLHRHLSVAEPWFQLRKSIASSEQLSVPIYRPLTTVFAYVRSGPRPSITVLGLSLICLFNLILVFISGGLFEPQVHTYLASSNLSTSYADATFIGHELDPDFRTYDRSVYYLMSNQLSLPWATRDTFFLPFTIEDTDATAVRYTTVTHGIGSSLTCDVVAPNNTTINSDSMMNWTYSPSTNPALHCTVQLPIEPINSIQPTMQYAWPDDSDCQRLGFFVSSSIPLQDNQTHTPLYCTPYLNLQLSEIQVDFAGRIQKHTIIPNNPPTPTNLLHQNLSIALASFNQHLSTFVYNLTTHPHPLPHYLSSFPNAHTATLYRALHQAHPANTTHALITAIQCLYQQTFTNYLTLHHDTLFPHGPLVDIPGTTTYTLWGFLPSRTSILIIIVIMSLDVLALVTVFALYYGRYDAPRIPKAIGSLMPWVGGVKGLQRLTRMSELRDEGKEQEYKLWSQRSADGDTLWVLGEVEVEVELEEVEGAGNSLSS